MRPDIARFLEVAAAHMLFKTGPALGSGYEQSNALVLGAMLMNVREEFERAAARRVEENDALRKRFAGVGAVVVDEALRARLEAVKTSGQGKPMLAPHEDSRSQDLLDALAALESQWPGRRRAVVSPAVASR